MSIKNIIQDELEQKKAELNDLYLKFVRNDLKETHLLKNKKKEIARILTGLSAKGDK